MLSWKRFRIHPIKGVTQFFAPQTTVLPTPEANGSNYQNIFETEVLGIVPRSGNI